MTFGSKSKSEQDAHTMYPRRGSFKWSATIEDAMGQLRSVNEARNVKSIMKVGSLEDSLRSCEPPKKRAGGSKKKSSLRLLAGLNPLRASRSKEESDEGPPSRGLLAGMSMGRSLRNIPFPRLASKRNGREGNENNDAVPEEAPVVVRSESAPPTVERKVSYDSLHFREYEILAGDNPGVSKGPALELGWEYADGEPLSVDAYESSRDPRRKMKEIRLSRAERERRLRESGVTEKELKNSVRKVNMAKAQRKKTLEMINSDGAERNQERIENMGLNFRRMFRMRKTESKREDELWDNANKQDNLLTSKAA